MYSYRTEQVIEFERLSEAGLFGIFGATGSGKSSILEAICLAIYGRTERLDGSVNKYYNLMNLRSNTLYVELQLKAGPDDSQFTASVKMKRHGKNFTVVPTPDRKFYKSIGEQQIPVTETVLHEAIGISYENFVKTIIIPQGKFQDFLHLKGLERNALMSELFQLDKYDLSAKTKLLETENDRLKSNTEALLAELAAATQEAVTEKEAALTSKISEKTELSGKLTDLKNLFEANNALKTLFEEKAQAEARLLELIAEVPRMELLEKDLLQYEEALQFLAGPLKEKQDAEKRLKETKERSLQLTRRHLDFQTELAKLKPGFDAKKEEYETRDRLHVMADNWDAAAELLEARGAKLLAEDGLHKAGPFIAAQENVIISLKTTLTALENEAITLQTKAGVENEILPKILLWYSQKKGLVRNIDKAAAELASQEKALRAALAQQANLLPGLLASALINAGLGPEFGAYNVRLVAFESKLQASIRESESLLAELNLKNRLKKYAHELHNGEPCPLCGSLEHPSVVQSESVEGELLTAQVEKARLDDLMSSLTKTRLAVGNAETEAGQLNAQIRRCKENLQQEEQNLEKHKSGFVWPAYALVSEAELEQRNAEAIAAGNLASKKMQEARLQAQKLESEQTKLQNYLQRKADLQKEISEAGIKEEQFFKRITVLDPGKYEGKPAADCRREAKVLRQRHSRVAEEYRELLSEISRLNTESDGLGGQLKMLRETLDEQQETLQYLKTAVADLLAAKGYTDEGAAQIVLQKNLQIAALRTQAAAFRANLKTAELKVTEITAKTSAKDYNPLEHAAIGSKLQEYEVLLSELHQVTGAMQSQITDLQRQLIKKATLTEELNHLASRETDIAVLKRMFSGKGFINYVVKGRLQALCSLANQRFQRLTRNSLSLFVDSENNFMVRDYLNEGRERSVKTLSGGQTFQAALCLALALSDSIGATTRRDRNFFFLDEGFGSQDKESLAVVFDTLKQLRRENRIVGVISHVEEMQEEIESAIKVTNNGDEGSLVSYL